MTRSETCHRIQAEGLVPIIRARSPSLAIRAAKAILAGGISIIEVTMTVPDAMSVIHSLRAEFGDGVVLGAGTVLDEKTVRSCVDAGADFIVSPGFDAASLAAAHACDVPMMPGALTPTEVMAAWRAGADMVKIFPCSALGGPAYLRALRGPLPQVKYLVTGGVNATTAADYIAAGASALGIGSELVGADLLDVGRDSVITDRARELVAVLRTARVKTP
jgi:2-dehydro-3-deoxyphosphogluconate aldolase/(4S)-4-hydroxy-2-oxoglutarate aldolase